MTPECVYDQSIEAVAVMPTLSPQSTLPTEYPLSALLTMSAAQSPPEADTPLKETRRPPSMTVPGGLP